jgi:hypothetical protein
MVWHQAIGPNINSKFLSVMSKKVSVYKTVLVIEKDRLTIVAALRDMVRIANSHRASIACHVPLHRKVITKNTNVGILAMMNRKSK